MIDQLGFTILALGGWWLADEATKKPTPEKKRDGWISREWKEEHRISDIFGYDTLTKEEQSQVDSLIYMISDDGIRDNMDGYRIDNHWTTYKERINKGKGVPVDSKIIYSKDEIKQRTQILYSMVDYRRDGGSTYGNMTKEEVLQFDLERYQNMSDREDIEFCNVVREIIDEERIYRGLVPFKEMLEKENSKPKVKKEKNLFDYAEEDNLYWLEPIKEISENKTDDIDDDLSWLSSNFKPGKIIHHSNKK